MTIFEIFGDRMTNLCLIDFKVGLYINVNVNCGRNKFEVHISKHLAINWRKIGQMPVLRVNIKWAELGHPILTFFFKCSFLGGRC